MEGRDHPLAAVLQKVAGRQKTENVSVKSVCNYLCRVTGVRPQRQCILVGGMWEVGTTSPSSPPKPSPHSIAAVWTGQKAADCLRGGPSNSSRSDERRTFVRVRTCSASTRERESGCRGDICAGCEMGRLNPTILESLFDIKREDRTSYSTNTEGRRA